MSRLALVRGVVLGSNVPLGPFETPAVALRWFLAEPWAHALGSGWLGDDPVLTADDGRRVRIALRGADLVTHPRRVQGPLHLEPATPEWVHDVLERRWWRFFRLDFTTWTERALVAGDRVEIVGERLSSSSRDYRSAADDVDAVVEGGVRIRLLELSASSSSSSASRRLPGARGALP